MKTAEQFVEEIAAVVQEFHATQGIPDYAKPLVRAVVVRIVEDSFRLGFEHAVAGGEEAARYMQKGTLPLVLYFGDEEGRAEFIKIAREYLPRLQRVKIPERKP